MHFAIPDERPHTVDEDIAMLRGAKRIIILFLLTITTAVCFHNFLGSPPVIGMLTGLGYLKLMGFYLKKTHLKYEPKAASHADLEGNVGKHGTL